ncbi:tryptophan--tRNA ligase [Alcaligenes endophyticus]|uniref:Tryptophan--tRNA ligase n=1 Tax=Alcaligenes endophyticus TaxID=1929088 RepID=A0ABT8END8_9BURK|nr:tryptophan--tRNA ligase [Alcaligenes endophyticus]MCX5591361.1 tryptophan--tRNA ligase [Alcaligenes endophyticus]MDN4122758.1 tryptophan--tRNA ligase [Alcaligenes endophyticus]
MKTRVLTGITTSGIPHLGNYAGALRPAIRASQQADVDAFFFMADYHALIKCDDAERVAYSRLAIAATWLAAGLDPERVTFYRQSDIPEIPELNWVLNCVSGKGLLNRAHAYKAAVDQNELKGTDPDDGISMGLFCYPVLMAADILLFNAQQVPVGRDQVQHIEMTRDMAQRFNHLYAPERDIFVLPEVLLDDDVAILPGLDGRKMSKSYDNTIPLFEGGSAALKAAIARIVTDSRAPGQAKEAEGSHLFMLYQAFSSAEQSAQLRDDLQQGLAWGEAKQRLYELLESLLAPMRERYFELLARPERIEDILQAGADKARAHAIPLMQQVRAAVGLRGARQTKVVEQTVQKSKKAKFIQFRESDGKFHFRLIDGDNVELFLSVGFDNPKEAGALIKALQGADFAQYLVTDAEQVHIVWEERHVANVSVEQEGSLRHALESFQGE